MRLGARIVVVFTLVFCCGALSPYGLCNEDPCESGGCLGPNAPALVDTNENGLPDPGIDLEITIEVGPSGIVIDSPWHCDKAGVENVVNFLDSDVKRGGKIVSAQRSTSSGMIQRVEVVPSSFVEGRPTRVSFEELKPGAPVVTGWAELQDRNSDGLYERAVMARDIAGGVIKVELNFIGADVDGDKNPDYVSIPWAYSDMVGVAVGDGCGPVWTFSEDPQVWIPLVDTDKNGAPDSIVADLDGDFQADSLFFWTPQLSMVAAPGRPYVPGDHEGHFVHQHAEMGLGALILGLAVGGWLTLRRRGVVQ
jgi:hypothetical protein